MKLLNSMTIALATIALFSSNARAQNIRGFFAPARIPVLVALDCGGTLRLSATKHWRDAGFVLPPAVQAASSSGNFAAMQESAYQVANVLSPTVAFLVFKQDFSGQMKNAEFDAKAGFNARELGLPVTAEGCTVVPLAVNMSRVREGAAYIVDEASFRRLTLFDQMVAKLLLNATRADAIRFLLDARSSTATDAVRLAAATAAKVPTLILHGLEMDLSKKFSTFPNGRLAAGYYLQKNDYARGVTYFDSGRTQTLHSRGGYVARVSNPDEIAVRASSDADAVRCNDAEYESNGKMRFCDGTVFRDGVEVSSHGLNLRFSTSSQESVVDTYEKVEKEFGNAPGEADIDMIVSSGNDDHPVVATFRQRSNKQIKSIQLLTGDTACGDLRFKNRVRTPTERKEDWEPKPGISYEVTFELPPACRSGAFRVKFGAAPSGKK